MWDVRTILGIQLSCNLDLIPHLVNPGNQCGTHLTPLLVNMFKTKAPKSSEWGIAWEVNFTSIISHMFRTQTTWLKCTPVCVSKCRLFIPRGKQHSSLFMNYFFLQFHTSIMCATIDVVQKFHQASRDSKAQVIAQCRLAQVGLLPNYVQ
jgi:hypothetical protein